MSCTGEYNFCVVAGDSLDFTVRYKAEDVYVDLTRYKARMQLRKRANDDTAVDLTCVISDALNGEVTASLTPEQTALLVVLPKTKNRYLYDLEIESQTGNVTTLVTGSIDVTIGVTR